MVFPKHLIDQAETQQRGLFLKQYFALLRQERAGQGCLVLRETLLQEVQRSITRVNAIKAVTPPLSFPENLPVSQQREDIARLIVAHQVLVVAGETGSGKTTQLPKICLGMGLGARGLIGHTQPRRLAARAIAHRIAEEIGDAGKDYVGFKVRFTDDTHPGQRIKLMTDGILLNELQSDPYLNEYEVLIIDEAHERSLNIDFILGYLKHILPKRPELKLIITSATLDPERFSRHFNGAPVLEVSGRVYPVELRYRCSLDADEGERDLAVAVLNAVKELYAEEPGDILVFLSGEREILEVAELLQTELKDTVIIVPLYARLSLNDQNRVFQLQSKRRIVLSTNIAETSLTVPGIRYVIDSGFARMSRYSYRTKFQRLPIEPISQASANQRMGRCGRLGPGVCIRLYSEEDFFSRPEFTEAEILRTNLASVILQMLYLRLGDIESFPFVDAPDHRAVRDGFRVLEELNALDQQRSLTKTGSMLARLPVEPRFGRMLIEAAGNGCLHEALVIVSFLSIPDPRERPLDKQEQADQKHRRFQDPQSDFLTIVNLWEYAQIQRKELGSNVFKRLCRQDFLNVMRVREWSEVYQQLTELCRILGLKRNRNAGHRDFVHKALLSGLLSHIGCKTDAGDYQGARNSRFFIFPASVLYKHKPQWVMAAELAETNRLFARINAAIQPVWLEKTGEHLIKRSYRDPHWEMKRGCVVAMEQQTLYGLIVVADRKINYSKHNPRLCRDIFIRQGLIAGQLISSAVFLQHNRDLKKKLEEEEQRHRQVVFHWDANRLYDYFSQRIPEGICTAKAFNRWYRKSIAQNPKLLCLRREDVVENILHGADILFPECLQLNGLQLWLDYRFEPGHAEDGVTVRIPFEIVNQLRQSQFDFLIPGLLHEKITGLIKSLPKSLRRHFVPTPDFARACYEALEISKGDLLGQLEQILLRMTGVRIERDQWNESRLAEHMRFKLALVDGENRIVARSCKLEDLQRFKNGEQRAFGQLHAVVNIPRRITPLDLDELSSEIYIETPAGRIKGFRAILDRMDHAELVVVDTCEKAEMVSKQGIRRLLLIQNHPHIKYVLKQFPELKDLTVIIGNVGSAQDLINDMISAVIDRCLGKVDLSIVTRALYEQWNAEVRYVLIPETTKLANQLLAMSPLLQSIKSVLVPYDSSEECMHDIHRQLDDLFFSGFITIAGIERILRYPSYLHGLQLRLEKLQYQIGKDQNAMQAIKPWLYRLRQFSLQWRERFGEGQPLPPSWWRFRWMLEEYRLSLFAQSIKTVEPVSEKRLLKYWQQELEERV